MKSEIIIDEYKFPGCQTYWTIRRKQFTNYETYVFDISMGYSTFNFNGKTIEEAEDYLLNFIKKEAHKKLITAERLVTKLDSFVEDEYILSREQLLEKYKKDN